MPSHDVIRKGDEALCAIPHRGGKSAEGVGDGAGVSVDLSVEFFGAITGESLRAGHFGVANCFVPTDTGRRDGAVQLVGRCLAEQGFETLLVRAVPVDHSVARPAAERYQLPIMQWVFRAPSAWERAEVDAAAHHALLVVEAAAYADAASYAGLYPLSLSARTQVLMGRLNSGEVIGYFRDLCDPRHSVRSFGRTTAPCPSPCGTCSSTSRCTRRGTTALPPSFSATGTLSARGSTGSGCVRCVPSRPPSI